MTFSDGTTTITWNTGESFATIKLADLPTGVLDLRSGRNKSCETQSEFLNLAKLITEGSSTSHLDIH